MKVYIVEPAKTGIFMQPSYKIEQAQLLEYKSEKISP